MHDVAASVTTRRYTSNDLFRYCRLVHGWLSAIAFLALCFFSITGLLLNHPGWLTGSAPAAIEEKFQLTGEQLEEIRSADVPGEALMRIAAGKVAIRGEYSDGDLAGRELFVRLQGVRGMTDLRAHLVSGDVTVIVEPAPTGSVLNELHRAERAGSTWRIVVDVVAVLLVVLSIVGYTIFLSLRFRLRTALLLTGASAIGLWATFVLAVR